MSTFFRKFCLYLSLISLVFGLFNFAPSKQAQAKILEPVLGQSSTISVTTVPQTVKDTSVVPVTVSTCPAGQTYQAQGGELAINSNLGVYTGVSNLLFSSSNCFSSLTTNQVSIQNNLQIANIQNTPEVAILKESPVSIAVNFKQPVSSSLPQTTAIAFVFSAILVTIKRSRFSSLGLKTLQNLFELKTLSLSQLGVMRC